MPWRQIGSDVRGEWRPGRGGGRIKRGWSSEKETVQKGQPPSARPLNNLALREQVLDLVGFSVSSVDGTDQAVVADVFQVTPVLEPRSTSRD